MPARRAARHQCRHVRPADRKLLPARTVAERRHLRAHEADVRVCVEEAPLRFQSRRQRDVVAVHAGDELACRNDASPQLAAAAVPWLCLMQHEHSWIAELLKYAAVPSVEPSLTITNRKSRNVARAPIRPPAGKYGMPL